MQIKINEKMLSTAQNAKDLGIFFDYNKTWLND